MSLSQEQSVVSSAIVTIIAGYILWSLMQTGNFLPYVSFGTPNTGNILLFLVLVSLVAGGIATLSFLILSTVLLIATKKERNISGATVAVFNITADLLIFFTALLHVFHLVSFQVSLLSYVIISGIVVYGRFKDKFRFRKYLNAGTRARETKTGIKI